MQSDDVAEPELIPEVPEGQLQHVDDAVAEEKKPWGQLEQDWAPADAYFPTEQSRHSDEPVVIAKVPGLHCRHDMDAERENDPSGQSMQSITDVAPAELEYFPAEHAEHEFAPSRA